MPQKRDLSSYFKQVESLVPQKKAKKDYTVEGLFNPTFKDGKTSVVIRFLPSHPNEFKPFVENRKHLFKVKGDQWFGCGCNEKFGLPCPLCDYNKKIWAKYGKNKEKVGDKEEYIAKKYLLGGAKSDFYGNILVVKNNNAPETEGKVFRLKFGITIMRKINDAMQGHDDEQKGWQDGFNPFDWNEGADFTLTGVMGAHGPKWDDSAFGDKCVIRRFDRKANDGKGAFKALSEAEQDAIEAQLWTLDDIEEKEGSAEEYAHICDRYAQKTGTRLEKTINAENADEIEDTNTVEEPSSKKGDVKLTLEAEDAVEEKTEVAETTHTEKSTTDESDFFSQLEGL